MNNNLPQRTDGETYGKYLGWIAGLALLMALSSAYAASSDEIQVYDDAINKPGELSVDMHLNYVVSGVRQSSYPKEIPSNHDFRMTPEFAYGIDPNWEGGLYLPAIRSADGNWYAEGLKFRMKYIGTHDEIGPYWGVNGELGYSSHRTEEHNWNFELRPIIGYRTEAWAFALNPILGFPISGNDHTSSFSPGMKVGRKISQDTWLNLENYSDFGMLDNLRSRVQETYLTVDTEVLGHELNFGVGHGWTHESNDTTIKAIISLPL